MDCCSVSENRQQTRKLCDIKVLVKVNSKEFFNHGIDEFAQLFAPAVKTIKCKVGDAFRASNLNAGLDLNLHKGRDRLTLSVLELTPAACGGVPVAVYVSI